MTVQELAKMIDHTLLSPFAKEADLKAHCEIAKKYNFKTVAINNATIELCKEELKDSDVLCDAAVSFPLGQCTLDTKVFETIDAIEKGAMEVDYVVNLVKLKSGDWDYVEEEMTRIVAECNKRNAVSKVIFENCYLDESEKRKLCEIATRVKPTFIKTSTGFGTGGATLEDVKLMKECVGDAIKIKAAGGVRTIDQALAMIEAGASRIGTSNGVAIVDAYKERV
ncbi:deoxyribose-phosphate aldolase [Candidatus Epulonipiscium fishelsonii]|uniref:Deoxyribose-phosphate aldolase n=1 Tax=Candidatus Epulonipiscium fishelsonii TaxID=77094 RepID=A0ACC8XH17_9FIRM|nr:deoxyribose-phosphate aldolase [Epulopiscium sp. SCG-B05WGA-EpuloA1]ONI42987.1 deoxyribose-phosphate aldolase [Epulopiscium sp. SCG-B11WGA-EpuloA1]